MRDPNDTKTADLIEETRSAGRPAKYQTDAERKAARAAAARARRARERAEGYREVRRLVKTRPEPLESDIIDLSHLPEHRRK